MTRNKALIALDVGEKRIGLAVADGAVPIARPLTTLDVDGKELQRIVNVVEDESADAIVIGYPRNQSGDPTAQTAFVESFANRLGELTNARIVFQDESLTSVLAEERLRSYGRPYSKSDIDALAATLILQDYLEAL
jgi:putative Holliday junction resolvase